MHGLLIVFAGPRTLTDAERMAALQARVEEIRAIAGCPRVVHQLVGRLNQDDVTGVMREPFGFADGISQPYIESLTQKPTPPGVREVRTGEFVLGYLNELGRFPASPSVARDPHRLLPRIGATGRADLGRNGTFLVARQLEQDVAAFERAVAGNECLAARLVGRWRNGAALVTCPEAPPPGPSQRELEAQNGFGYHREDRYGFRCPIGAHIRRANPRDSLADGLGIGPAEAQALVDQHRILRRGRVYRANGRQGLMFICLNANIERQFEFVQSAWLLNREFGGLQDEVDPLLGNGARAMTLQMPVLGQRYEGLQQFVTVRGGGYFFLPGLRALEYLSLLGD